MFEALGGIIVFSIAYFVIWVWRFKRDREKDKERQKFTYDEIASKYSLWDEHVNFYDEEKKQMDYETFTKFSLDQKKRMLISRFGEENTKS